MKTNKTGQEIFVRKLVDRYGGKRANLLAILHGIQDEYRCISGESVSVLAAELGLERIEIEGVISFYHFFTQKPTGRFAIYLDDSPVAFMAGREEIARAFEKETGAVFGSNSPDDFFSLHDTPCTGMSDQSPAALINGTVFTSLTTGEVSRIVNGLKNGKSPADLVENYGDGQNRDPRIRAMVKNNIRLGGPVILSEYTQGESLRTALGLSPDGVIEKIKASNLRGRGGAGFPTGMKWEFCRNAKGSEHHVICNADEGEPGTFKDRVLLTEYPHLLFDGMTIAAYVLGSTSGFVYLRAEYRYLFDYLEGILEDRRHGRLLGENILAREGFNFEIEIKLGAGAYICGEESALIESAEGKRGEPRTRPPFPAQVGFMGQPTVVNNVETFCAAARIIEHGPEWFKEFGTTQSAGTKILSVSGDCESPGIYEVPFGLTIRELIEKAGGVGTMAVQVGGASGTCIGENDFSRKICFEDMATGGSIMLFNDNRDIFTIVKQFIRFFVNESCGVCVPCRVGNVALLEKLNKIEAGKGTFSDVESIASWSRLIKATSRCGLGQTSSNPILTTLSAFPEIFASRVNQDKDFIPYKFDMTRAIRDCCEYVNRSPVLEDLEV